MTVDCVYFSGRDCAEQNDRATRGLHHLMSIHSQLGAMVRRPLDRAAIFGVLQVNPDKLDGSEDCVGFFGADANLACDLAGMPPQPLVVFGAKGLISDGDGRGWVDACLDKNVEPIILIAGATHRDSDSGACGEALEIEGMRHASRVFAACKSRGYFDAIRAGREANVKMLTVSGDGVAVNEID